MKKIVVILILIAAVAGGVFFFLGGRNGQASAQLYKLGEVKTGSILATVSSSGSLTALNTVKVGSQISGNITEINVDFNSRVKKGDMLCLIDPSSYEVKVDQAEAALMIAQTNRLERQKDILVAEANVDNARANVHSARAELTDAQSKYERLNSLLASKTVAASEVEAALARRDKAIYAVEMAESRVKTALAQLEGAKAQYKGADSLIAERASLLKLARLNLSYCRITSPIDGIVIYRAADLGQTVASSLQSPILFHIAEDLTRMKVEIDVSEADVGQIKDGQTVEFTVDAFPDRKFKAEVRQVRFYSKNVQNVVTYEVIAEVDNSDLVLRPGMTANVNIVVAKEQGVLKVPNSALRFRPLGEIKEASEQARQPKEVTQTAMYKMTVEKLKLTSEQAKAYEEILTQARAKLAASVQGAAEGEEGGGNRRAAFGNYLKQVYAQLGEILDDEQKAALRAYLAEQRQKRRDNAATKPATVYVPGEDGQPVKLNVRIGIANDTETQIVNGLEEGDKVITGIDVLASGQAKGSPFKLSFSAFSGGPRR